jgi:hypothetical protein
MLTRNLLLVCSLDLDRGLEILRGIGIRLTGLPELGMAWHGFSGGFLSPYEKNNLYMS